MSCHRSFSRFGLGMLSGVLLLLLAACGPQVQPPSPDAAPASEGREEPKQGGTIRFYLRADPAGGFEPHIPGGRRDARRLLGQSLQGTLAWDNKPGEFCTTVLSSALAEKWRFVDDSTIELAMRKGVKFHDKPPVNGREMTAEDVVWSYQRMFGHGILKNEAKNVVSMEAPDKYTVRVKTKAPGPMVPANWFAFREAMIVAKEAGGESDDLSRPETLIGTGPFILESYTPGVKAVYKRNPNYWKSGLPYVNQVEFPIMRDDATRLAAIRTGQLDYLDEVTSAEKGQVAQAKPEIRFITCETTAPFFVFMRNDAPPFNNVNVRRAVSMAIDRGAILKGVYKGEGKVIGTSPSFVEGAMKPEEFPPQVRKYLEYNPTEAKKLLAEAGYPDGLKLKVESTRGYGSPYNEVLEVVGAMFKTAGIEVELDLADLAQHQSTHTRGKYDAMMLGKSGTGSTPIEKALAGPHSNNGFSLNRAHVNDPEYDRLADRMLSTTDPGKRLEVVRQMQTRIVEQAYYAVTPTFFDFHAVQPWLKGTLKVNSETFRSAGWLLFEEAWVDKP